MSALASATNFLWNVVGSAGSVLHGLFNFLGAALHVALLLMIVLIAYQFLQLVKRSGKAKSIPGNQPKLFKVHDTTACQHIRSIASRMAEENPARAVGAPAPATGPAPAPAPAPAAASKPVAVLRFEGDVRASGGQGLARLIDELVINKDRLERAVVVVNSPGGGVSEYGQLFAEMERIHKAGLRLTVCIDRYGASGGYLMSLPADEICAAPYAMVGSIGVVSEIMNFNKLLKTLGIDSYIMTAGEFKRTMTSTGVITEEAQEHYKAQLKAIHDQFIADVTKYRGNDVAKYCTGDHWTAARSVEEKLGIVDRLATSQEYLLEVNQNYDLVEVSEKKNRFENGVLRMLSRLADYVMARIESNFSSTIR